jgi:subtilase family serine protease
MSAGFSAQNIGNLDAPSTVYVSFYLSGNNTFSPDDTFLKKLSAGKLKKGASKKITLSVTLPVGVTVSGKYVIAVVDPQNAISESDENNNQIVYGPIP